METTIMDFDNKIYHCRQESDSWKRVLDFLQTENNHLKFSLSNALDKDACVQFLGKAESLQQELIQKDELIALTKDSLADFDKCLSRPHIERGNCIEQIFSKQARLRQRMEQIEQTFSKHKAGFNDYLASGL